MARHRGFSGLTDAGSPNADSGALFLLPQVLFLGPLIQLSMDCPWDLVDGLKVAFGKAYRSLPLVRHSEDKALGGGTHVSDVAPASPPDPRFWVLCLTDMRWIRNQIIAPFTEELVFRACMLPMLVPCTGLGPAIFTCPLFFGVGECQRPPSQLGGRGLTKGCPAPYCHPAFSSSPPAHFHHVIEQLRFRQGSTATIFLSAGRGRGGPWLCRW